MLPTFPIILLILLILSKNLPAPLSARIICFFTSSSLSFFVLDRIYRIYKIKNVAYVSLNPVNLVNPV